jgi:hypothetical protein
MPQIPRGEFERLPLRVHGFLAGVPLHDAWAIDLAKPHDGITLADFLHGSNARPFTPSPAVRGLLRMRFFIGKLFGWDDSSAGDAGASFAERLTPEDRARSLVPAGTADGAFRIVYRFENEQLSELTNRTVHAATLTALVESATAYRFYFAVYVRSVGPLTPFYLASIGPFRKLIVYPSLLRSVAANWNRTFAATSTAPVPP